MDVRVKRSEEMRSAVSAFLEVGNERNRLVHQDYVTFPMEKTLDEIYMLYRSALAFVEVVPGALRDGDGVLASPPTDGAAESSTSVEN